MDVEQPLLDVTPSSRSWSCKVIVLEKLNTRHARWDPEKTYKSVIMQDSEGHRVKGMIYGIDIPFVDDRLHLNKTYVISNARVTPVMERYSVPDEQYRYTWTLNRRTLIIDVNPDHQLFIQPNLEAPIDPFHTFYTAMLNKSSLNVLDTVLAKLPRQEVRLPCAYYSGPVQEPLGSNGFSSAYAERVVVFATRRETQSRRTLATATLLPFYISHSGRRTMDARGIIVLVLATARMLMVAVGLTLHLTQLSDVSMRRRLNVEPSELEAASIDFGGMQRKEPMAVLRPESADDVAQLVRAAYESEHGFTVSAWGHGHLINGQAGVRDGVVVEMSGYGGGKGVKVSAEAMYADVWGGELWVDVLRDKVALGQVRVLHVPSSSQYADIFTKGLPSLLFSDFRHSLGIRPSPVT
ncbi:unnamed protein product [Cuscuta campestris]|uniref:FAD-binding PCMH-type domain-containing protein n=1 Tax=Cuscuta campestris TaxID=132261 RepID=A0A484M692_9ASTE|nr:unnamed protein product [Cuscuta campestris]